MNFNRCERVNPLPNCGERYPMPGMEVPANYPVLNLGQPLLMNQPVLPPLFYPYPGYMYSSNLSWNNKSEFSFVPSCESDINSATNRKIEGINLSDSQSIEFENNEQYKPFQGYSASSDEEEKHRKP